VIVAFSTSSPVAGVALISEDGSVIASAHTEARMAASGACLRQLDQLLRERALSIIDATLFAADLGPGSFTGVKVGVTLAKAFAFALGVPASGAESFDLIDANATVAIPSKRGEFFLRPVGSDVVRVSELPQGPFVGYGPGVENPIYPSPERFSLLLRDLRRVPAEALLPHHAVEPSISEPKRPFARRELGG
jgi:hypothetical protein